MGDSEGKGAERERMEIDQRAALRAAQSRRIGHNLAQEIELRERLERELRESRSNYRSLKENSPPSLLPINREGPFA